MLYLKESTCFLISRGIAPDERQRNSPLRKHRGRWLKEATLELLNPHVDYLAESRGAANTTGLSVNKMHDRSLNYILNENATNSRTDTPLLATENRE